MTTGDVSLAVAVPPGAPTAKKVTVATLVSIGAVVGVVAWAIDEDMPQPEAAHRSCPQGRLSLQETYSKN